MPGPLAPHFLARNLDRLAGGGEREVLPGRGLDPALDLRRLRRRERQLHQRRERRRRGPRQLAQRLAPVGEHVLGLDQLRRRELVARAGVVDVGDGREPHLEACFGDLELARDRGPLRLGEREPVARREHLKVRLRGARDERLAGGGELGLGAAHLGPRPAQTGERRRVVHRLREAQRVAFAVKRGAPGRPRHDPGFGPHAVVVAHRLGGRADEGQQPGARLRQAFLRRAVGGRGRPEAGIVALGLAVDVEQIGAVRGEREEN